VEPIVEEEETVETSAPITSNAEEEGQAASSSSSSSCIRDDDGIEIIADHDDFITPERDVRRYRIVRLPNNLKVLLVSDQMTSGVGVEAASVHVQAGHFDDTLPGLARTFYH
jgi:hypothetical protein